MVIGIVTNAIRIGSILYKVYRFQDRTISKAYRGFPRGVGRGVSHGAGLGTIAGSAIEYYKQEEDGGNLIGVPERKTGKGRYRQRQTRSKIFKSARGRRCAPYGRYRRR